MDSLAVPEQKKARTVTCRAHCAGCDRHFSGDEAFSMHRAGSFRNGERRCVAPEEVLTDAGAARLVAKSEDGRCDIGYSQPVRGVTVWQTAAAAQSGGWE